MRSIAVDRDGVLDSPVGQETLHIIKTGSIMDFYLKDKHVATCKSKFYAFLQSQKDFFSAYTIKGKSKRHHQNKTNTFLSLKEAAKSSFDKEFRKDSMKAM